jgi:hypothetical protein
MTGQLISSHTMISASGLEFQLALHLELLSRDAALQVGCAPPETSSV